MSSTVREFFSHKEKPGSIGMELEVEALAPIGVAPPSNIWLVKDDGSLRNFGYEYYTRNPINPDHNLFPRIKELTDFLGNKAFAVDYNSTRTSFHVHINACEHTLLQMWNQVFIYWLLEEPLMNICGKSRCGNQFCLRTKDAEAQVNAVRNILEDVSASPELFNSDNLRYSSQNLKALHQFGSLEYRGMRGSHDPTLLYTWTHGLWYMSQRAKDFQDPKQVIKFFDVAPREQFIRTVLSPKLAALVMAQPNYKETTSEQFDMIFDLVYDTDWEYIENNWGKMGKKTPTKLGMWGIAANPEAEVNLNDLAAREIQAFNMINRARRVR